MGQEQDLREVIIREEHGDEITANTSPRFRGVLRELNDEFDTVNDTQYLKDDGQICVEQLDNTDSVIRITHSFDAEIPYDMRAAIQRVDCLIATTHRAEDTYADDAISRTAIWAAPKASITDDLGPDTPQDRSVFDAHSHTSSSTSSTSNRRSQSVSRSNTSQARLDEARKARTRIRNTFIGIIAVGLVRPVTDILVSEIVQQPDTPARTIEVVSQIPQLVNFMTFFMIAVAVPNGVYGFLQLMSNSAPGT
ncbi:hypothetical protein [Salinibaculum rarum]|uniref:hypothetical protein n=1 Tax=Salinibaculum rarum TaxID=3058903 RepID=UPI00265FCDFE|nr:hypothetical protein [Salinibaculum sp. KK48]